MNNRPLNVLICGLNWSGSGAVFDLFKEYGEVVPVSGGALDFPAEGGLRLMGEFEMFRAPGFIGDFLSGKENLFHPNHAEGILKQQILSFRFKTLLYILKLRSFKDIKYAFKIYRQVLKIKKRLILLIKDLRKTKDVEKRKALSAKWLKSVMTICQATNKKVAVFDQAIHLGQQIDVWPKFFHPFKLIIVHRDPRDILAEQSKYNYLYRGQMNSNAVALYGESLEDAIQYRIDTTFARMRQVDSVLSSVNKENVLLLRFEDLVKNYDEVKQKIQNFVGLTDQDHIYQRKFFDPSKSIKNIGVYQNSNLNIPKANLKKLITWYNNH